MNNDTLTTVLGIAKAVIVWAGTYAWTGFSPSNPLSWLGVLYGIGTALVGWKTNKPVVQ